MPTLFDPVRLGAIEAPNRIIMAPLTRARNTPGHVPTSLMIDYYRQRASAGLIVSEAIGISPQGLGWPWAPGIWNDEQVAAWRPVAAAVHDAGGRIVAQLWHMGRVVHPSMPGRGQPVSASATQAPGEDHTYQGKQPHVMARPLRLDEMPALLDDYRNAARNARTAGFDGIQIHSANGYLIDQFLRNGTNFRDDIYGGAIGNRIRLLREITGAIAEIVGPDRLSVRLSPNGDRRGVNDSDPEPLFAAVAEMLSDIGVAFLDVREPGYDGTFGKADRPPIAPLIRKAFKGPLVLNTDYTKDSATAALASGVADAIGFGRLFISNPDLVRRFAEGHDLVKDDISTWYTQDRKGYTDYPAAISSSRN